MDDLLTYETLATKLDRHPATLRKWVRQGKLPRPVTINRQTKFFVWSNVVSWIAKGQQ